MKKIVAFLMALMMLAALTACGKANKESSNATQNGSQQEKIVLRLGFTNNEEHPNYLASKQFADAVAQRTNGQVEVQLAPNSLLGGEKDLAEGMTLGTVEMALLGTGGMRVYDDNMQLFFLPFLFNSREAAYKVLDGDIGKEISAMMESKAPVKILAYYENGYRHITNSERAIYTPEDLKGLKIRTPEIPALVATFKGLGANPTPMAFGELFTAMQQKTVDGQENPLVTIISSKFYEVQKYCSLTGHVWDPFALTISTAAWNKLTPETQAIVQEEAKKAADYQRSLCVKADEEGIEQLKSLGCEVNEVDLAVWQEATKFVYDEYAKQFGEELIAKIRAVK